MKKAIMISFSGIDSAGKSTYIDLLKKHLNENDIKHKVIWSRGGYTSLFEFAKNILRMVVGKKLPVSGHSEKRDKLFDKKSVATIWYVMAMVDLIRLYVITLRIYKLMGYVVVCDRYIWDTYIDFSFQFSETKLKKSLLWRLLEFTYLKPAVSLFLFITPEESLKRSIEKKEPFSEPLQKRKARSEMYDALKNNGKWNNNICTENGSIIETWSQIRRVVDNAIL